MSGSSDRTRGIDGLVSILTPAHDAAPWLPETIASVRAQTHEDWEWWIVDDGSTDATPDVVEEAAREDPRIRLIRVERNTGLPATGRNRALAASRGARVAYLDADDLWKPRKLERQVRHLEESLESDGVCAEWEFVGDDPRTGSMRRPHPGGRIRVREIRRGFHFVTSSLLLRREPVVALGGMDARPELRVGEDQEFVHRFVARYRLDCMPDVLVGYRVRPSGDSLMDRAHAGEVVGLRVPETLLEKGEISRGEARAWRARCLATRAADNLFFHHAPFRGLLLRSVRTGRPPLRAVVMLALSVLPAPALRPVLRALRRLV